MLLAPPSVECVLVPVFLASNCLPLFISLPSSFLSFSHLVYRRTALIVGGGDGVGKLVDIAKNVRTRPDNSRSMRVGRGKVLLVNIAGARI